jgi:hypothetical protein
MLQEFIQGVESNISLMQLLMNIGVGIVLAIVLRWHFRRFGSTLSNREEFAQVFPFILLTTLLIITIVKSSLALSLGLVGALSIVRFRTPIKEPEELAYLFMAIAMGLGLGANQMPATVLAGLVILLVMGVLKRSGQYKRHKNLFLSLDWKGQAGDTQQRLDTINEVIGKYVHTSDLRRFDVRNGSMEVTYFVDLESAASLSSLVKELGEHHPDIGLTFIDQNQLPSV